MLRSRNNPKFHINKSKILECRIFACRKGKSKCVLRQDTNQGDNSVALKKN